MKKIIIFSLLLFMMCMTTVMGVTEIPINATYNTGDTNLDGGLAYDEYDDVFYMTGGFPVGYISIRNSTTYAQITTIPVGSSENYVTATSDNIFTIEFSNTNPDKIFKRYKNGTFISSTQVTASTDLVSITYDGSYLYALDISGTVYIYDTTLAYLGLIDVCSQVNDCPILPDASLVESSLFYNHDENIFYYYQSQSTFLYLLDESFNDITDNEYYIDTIVSNGWREFVYYNNSIYGKGTFTNTLLYQYLIPPTPPPPNYHTILNPVDGKIYNYSKQYCVTDDTYCTDTQYVLNANFIPQFYCDLNNSQYCSDSCTTTYNSATNTFYGVCSQLACENLCNVEGFTTCGTTRTYNICGNYDSDPCLEYSNDLFCTTNQYCADTELGAQCLNKTFVEIGDTYTQDVVQVEIDVKTIVVGDSAISESNIDTETVYTANNEQIEITFKDHPIAFLTSKAYNLFSVQTPHTTGQATVQTTATNLVTFTSENYYAVDCNYEETFTVEDSLNNNIDSWVTDNGVTEGENYYYILVNSSSNASRSLPESDQNKIIDTMIKPETSGLYYIIFNSSEGVISTLKITNNITSYNIIIEETDYNKTIVNNTGKSSFNDLEYISIQGRFNKDIKTLTYFVSVIRKPLDNNVHEDYYSLPIAYNDNNNQQPNSILYNTDNSMQVYQVLERTNSIYPSYTYNADIKDMLKTCVLDGGCTKVTTYANSDNMPTYHFSDTTEICLKDLKGNIVEPTDEREIESDDLFDAFFGTTLSPKFKLLLSMIVSAIPFLLGVLVFVVTRDHSTIFFAIGISALFFVSFALAGYLPVWVVIIAILIAGGIGTAIVKTLTIGSG